MATSGLTKSQQKLESEVQKKMDLMKEYYDREINGIKGSSDKNDDTIKELKNKMKFLEMNMANYTDTEGMDQKLDDKAD